MSIHSYAEQGDVEHLEQLLQNTSTSNETQQVSANTKDADQNTALHFAAAGGHLSCVQMLLKHHADIDAKNKFGVTPLHEACRNDKPNLVKLFVEKGAKIHAADSEGWTALHYAVYAKSIAVCEILIDLGAKVHAATSAGYTPLHIAASHGASDIILLLVKKGASLDAKDNNKVTPLSYLQKDKEAVKPTVPTQESACKDTLANYKQLLTNRQYSDLSLECSDNTSVNVHKCIISVQCPAILKPLSQANGQSKLKVEASQKVVQTFMEYLYCGNIQPEKLQALGTAFQMLSIACRFECDTMQKAAQAAIQASTKAQLAELKTPDVDYILNALKDPPSSLFSQFSANWILTNYSSFEPSLHKHITGEDLSRIVKTLLPKHNRDSNNNNHGTSKGISPKSFLEFKQLEEGVKTLEGKNLRICTNVTKALLKEPGAADWFGEPVDPVKLGIPDYPTIVHYPMDLGTVMKNLETGQYHNIAEWMADIRLVFANALLYNPAGTEVNMLARQLQESFERRLSSASSGFEKGNKKKKPTTPTSSKEPTDENATPKSPKSSKKRKPESKSNGSAKKVQKSDKTGSPSSSPVHPSSTSTTSSGAKTSPSSASTTSAPAPQKAPPPPKTTPPQKNQKPEAKPAAPRSQPQANNNTSSTTTESKVAPMSFEEKKQLGESMNKLTSEQLLEAIEIISASKNIEGQEDDSDTIDIDMNDMDENTLRKLEKFIKECFRANSKGGAA